MSPQVRAGRLLVIEDGAEYAEFARLFLPEYDLLRARSCAEALAVLAEVGADALLIDLRFDRVPREILVGDLAQTAARLFGGDRERAARYLEEQQGTLILSELRSKGYRQPALFVHDFGPRRLANLRKLYGAVDAVGSFDAKGLRHALSGLLVGP